MLIPDVLVYAALQSGFNQLTADPSSCRDFLVTLSDLYPRLFGQAVAFFGASPIQVQMGWDFEAPPDARVYIVVTLGASAETDHYIGGSLGEEDSYSQIGGDGDEDSDDVIIATDDVAGVNVREQVHITIVGQNQNVVVWASAAARWALLRKRRAMEQAGLVMQSTQMQDLRYSTDDLQEGYYFRRMITLTGTSNAEIVQTYTHHITDATVEVIDTRSAGSPTLTYDSEV